MSELSARVKDVRRRIAGAAERAGRSPAEVTLVAVSKTFSPSAIRAAAGAGLTTFGENRAQELAQKAAALGADVRWHFVGHLQTNKVRQVVGLATLIHSVDRSAVATEIDRRARLKGIVQEVLIEVNVTGGRTKHGVEPGRLPALAREVGDLENVALCGLMTMAPLGQEADTARPTFAALRELGADIATEFPRAVELSMGMTSDFEVAVEEGATIVRVGQAIFGKRAG